MSSVGINRKKETNRRRGLRKRPVITQDALFYEYLTRRHNHQEGLKVRTKDSNGKQGWKLTGILIYSYGFPIRQRTGLGFVLIYHQAVPCTD